MQCSPTRECAHSVASLRAYEDRAKQRASADSFASSGWPAPRAFDTRVLAAAARPLPSMKTQVCVLNAIPMLPRETSGSGNKPAHRAASFRFRSDWRQMTASICRLEEALTKHPCNTGQGFAHKLQKSGSNTGGHLWNVTGPQQAHRQCFHQCGSTCLPAR